MKKSISLIIAVASILLMSSCTGNKGCAAYAKHETLKQDTEQHHHQRPATYSEVQ